MALLLLAGTAAGGLMLVASARFQREQRFGISLALVHVAESAAAARRDRDDRVGIAHRRLVVRDSDARPRLGRRCSAGRSCCASAGPSSGRSRRRSLERSARARGRQRRGHAVHPARAARHPARAHGRRSRVVRRARRHCRLDLSRCCRWASASACCRGFARRDYGIRAPPAHRSRAALRRRHRRRRLRPRFSCSRR